MIAGQWVVPLRSAADPLETISLEFERGVEVLRTQRPILGCPLNNLAQEMNPLDEGFRARTSATDLIPARRRVDSAITSRTIRLIMRRIDSWISRGCSRPG